MRRLTEAARNIEKRAIINAIQELETRAHNIGLTVTGHALNRAKNAAGWEWSGDIVAAGRAALAQVEEGK